MSRRLLLAVLLLAACGSDPTPPPQWYFTCGDPLCEGHRPDPGVAPCSFETPGQGCAPEGARCDPVDACNRRLVCATSDPVAAPGGCPI
jgi:hypothetical protein